MGSKDIRPADRASQRGARNKTAVAWRLARGYYQEAVTNAVDELAQAGGATMLDLILISYAETLEAMDARLTDDGYEAGERWSKHIMSIQRLLTKQVEAIGGTGGLSNKPVPIPEGVRNRSSKDVDPVLELVTG